MIKKLLGVLCSLGIVALIIFVALEAGSYRSMLPAEWFSWMQTYAVEPLEVQMSIEQSDDISIDVDAEASTDDPATDDNEVIETE